MAPPRRSRHRARGSSGPVPPRPPTADKVQNGASASSAGSAAAFDARAAVTAIRDELVCGICLGVVALTCMLPCSHLFCAVCIFKCAAAPDGDPVDLKHKVVLLDACPTCRDPPKVVVRHRTMDSVVAHILPLLSASDRADFDARFEQGKHEWDTAFQIRVPPRIPKDGAEKYRMLVEARLANMTPAQRDRYFRQPHLYDPEFDEFFEEDVDYADEDDYDGEWGREDDEDYDDGDGEWDWRQPASDERGDGENGDERDDGDDGVHWRQPDRDERRDGEDGDNSNAPPGDAPSVPSSDAQPAPPDAPSNAQ